MKKTLMLILILCSSLSFGQVTYDLELRQDAGDPYLFTVYGVPNANATGADFSQAGIRIILETGNGIASFTDIIGDNWRIGGQFNATFLTTQGIGDGTKDYFYLSCNVSTGTSIFNHTNGTGFALFSFRVTGNPNAGSIEAILDTHPISTGLIGGGITAGNFVTIDPNDGSGNGTFGTLVGTTSYSFALLSVADVGITEFNILPNPNNGVFRINLVDNAENPSFRLMDIKGRVMNGVKTTFDNQSIGVDASNLATGIYIIQINNNQKRILIK